MMDITQLYQTTIADRERGYTAQFITVPVRSIAEENRPLLNEARAISRFLEIERPEPIYSPSVLPVVIATLIARDNPFDALERISIMNRDYRFAGPWPFLRFLLPDEDKIAFAEFVTFAEIIPFEQSPLDLHSLAGTIVNASPQGIGAVVGIAAGIQAPPLLLVTVPAGIILCTIAARLGPKIGEVLSYRLRRLMGVPTDRQ